MNIYSAQTYLAALNPLAARFPRFKVIARPKCTAHYYLLRDQKSLILGSI